MNRKFKLQGLSYIVFFMAIIACQDNQNNADQEKIRETLKDTTLAPLVISENDRFFARENGEPFFWLGDTGWLMFNRLTAKRSKGILKTEKPKALM